MKDALHEQVGCDEADEGCDDDLCDGFPHSVYSPVFSTYAR
jgi:hypothetical protein